jgi:hypothetical protein
MPRQPLEPKIKRIPKDQLREQIVEHAPAAPPGMKKHYEPETRSVRYVPKTARELLREGVRRGKP